jgi:hypothetical protein
MIDRHCLQTCRKGRIVDQVSSEYDPCRGNVHLKIISRISRGRQGANTIPACLRVAFLSAVGDSTSCGLLRIGDSRIAGGEDGRIPWGGISNPLPEKVRGGIDLGL